MLIIIKKMHLYGIYKRFVFFLINHIFIGMKPKSCAIKRCLLRSLGYSIGDGTTVVSPIHILGTIDIGKNCWINRGFTVHGNGHVEIGDNCDIAPDVVFLTGGHQIGSPDRRAGKGEVYSIKVGKGCWIGARSTILRNVEIQDGCVIAACACVPQSVSANSLVGGVPASVIRSLENGEVAEE